jgi:hypothetical protein
LTGSAKACGTLPAAANPNLGFTSGGPRFVTVAAVLVVVGDPTSLTAAPVRRATGDEDGDLAEEAMERDEVEARRLPEEVEAGRGSRILAREAAVGVLARRERASPGLVEEEVDGRGDGVAAVVVDGEGLLGEAKLEEGRGVVLGIAEAGLLDETARGRGCAGEVAVGVRVAALDAFVGAAKLDEGRARMARADDEVGVAGPAAGETTDLRGAAFGASATASFFVGRGVVAFVAVMAVGMEASRLVDGLELAGVAIAALASSAGSATGGSLSASSVVTASGGETAGAGCGASVAEGGSTMAGGEVFDAATAEIDSSAASRFGGEAILVARSLRKAGAGCDWRKPLPVDCRARGGGGSSAAPFICSKRLMRSDARLAACRVSSRSKHENRVLTSSFIRERHDGRVVPSCSLMQTSF